MDMTEGMRSVPHVTGSTDLGLISPTIFRQKFKFDQMYIFFSEC